MANPTRSFLGALTSARFLGALYIFLFHTYAMKGLTRATAPFQQFASVGYVAVSFFFVLSGFVLVYTYAGKPLNLPHFWRARLARLYPVYLLSLLITAPFFFYAVLKFEMPEFAWFRAHLTSTILLVLSMLQAWVPPASWAWNAVVWAVSVEIFFYMVFPILLQRFARVSTRGLLMIGAACWLAALAAAAAYVVISPDHIIANSVYMDRWWLNALKFNPLVRLPEFVMGMGCGYWFLRAPRRTGLATPLILGGAAAALAIIALSPRIPYPLIHTGLLAPAFAAIICGVAVGPRWIALLESRWLQLLGNSSYAFYLLHPMVIAMFIFPYTAKPERPASFNSAVPVATPARLIGALATAVVLAVLVYRFVEEPARRRLRGKPAVKSFEGAKAA